MTMHHTRSTTVQGRRCLRRTGFTLVEVLVVIGIMVAIAAIAIPMVNRARKAGTKTRVAADLQAIGVALDAYKNDFGDYPRFTPDNDNPADPEFLDGAEILCLALIGPRSENGVDTYPAGHASDTNDGDGADGPGFRTSLPPADAELARRRKPRTYGPYLEVGKFKMADPSPTAPADLQQHEPKNLVLLSYYDTPIVYFPARAQKGSVNSPGGYVAALPPTPVPSNHPVRGSMWDARYGVHYFRHGAEANDTTSISRLRVMLGDTDADGMLDPGETAAATGGYALWSAGHDDKFGPEIPAAPTAETVRAAVENCDDVTNFR